MKRFEISLLLLGALAIACLTADWQAASAVEPVPATDNPYAAAANLSRADLGAFIEKMQNKPVSLRKRAGFFDALIDAADRILATGDTDDLATLALNTKFSVLHEQALAGNTTADTQLAKLADAHEHDAREPIAEAAGFYRLERQALDADALDKADLAPLLATLKKYCSGHTLDQRHLRLASATVRIINRLPDATAAAAAYVEFGQLFGKSEDRELARYGKKIEKVGKPAAKPEPPAEDAPATDSDEP